LPRKAKAGAQQLQSDQPQERQDPQQGVQPQQQQQQQSPAAAGEQPAAAAGTSQQRLEPAEGLQDS
jgi:hypothetical protein